MTLPSASDDEVVSAVVDGEATAEEQARVEGDPVLAARAARFRQVRSALSAPVEPLPPEVAGRLLDTALAEGEAPAGPRSDDGPPVVTAPPIPLAPRRARRSAWVPGSAVAAAVIVVLAVVGIALLATAGGDSKDTAARAPTADLDASTRNTEKAASGGTNDDVSAAPTSTAPPATGGPSVPALGSFADQAALTRVLATVDLTTLEPAADSSPRGPAAGEPSQTAVDRCDQAIRAVPDQDLGDRLAVATAELGGRAVLVYSHPDRGASEEVPVTRLTVAEVESCQIRFAVQR